MRVLLLSALAVIWLVCLGCTSTSKTTTTTEIHKIEQRVIENEPVAQ
jgi:hypothetical protein